MTSDCIYSSKIDFSNTTDVTVSVEEQAGFPVKITCKFSGFDSEGGMVVHECESVVCLHKDRDSINFEDTSLELYRDLEWVGLLDDSREISFYTIEDNLVIYHDVVQVESELDLIPVVKSILEEVG